MRGAAMSAGGAAADHDTPIWDDGEMETPAEGLARLERMGQRARERRQAGEAEGRLQQFLEDADQVRRELRDSVLHFLAGPPDGCRHCWTWHWTPWHGWTWHHFGSHWIEVRPWDAADGEPTEFCIHDCHGPDGHPLPVVAYA